MRKEKAMNASELRDKTPDQLRDELANLKKESFNLRFQQATGQLENTAGIKAARRNAARVKTILKEEWMGNISDIYRAGVKKKQMPTENKLPALMR